MGNSARVGTACFLFPCAALQSEAAVPHGQEARCHGPSLCSEIEEQDAGVQGFLTPLGTDVLLAWYSRVGWGTQQCSPVFGRAEPVALTSYTAGVKCLSSRGRAR